MGAVFSLLGLLAVSLGLDAFSGDKDQGSEESENSDEGLDLTGTDAAETLDGSALNDMIFGDSGADSIVGDAGADTIDGGSGNDTIEGGAGDDVIYGYLGVLPDAPALDDFGNPVSVEPAIAEGFGADSLVGGEGNDTIYGTTGAMSASDPDDAPDTLEGGDGDDVLFLGNGDIATGGAGSDEFAAGTWVDPGTPAVIQDFNAAEDALVVYHDEAVPSDTAPVDPVVTVSVVGGDAVVLLDGMAVMQVTGGATSVTADMVRLVGASLT